MGNNEPAVDQSDLRIRGSYGLLIYEFFIYSARLNEEVEFISACVRARTRISAKEAHALR